MSRSSLRKPVTVLSLIQLMAAVVAFGSLLLPAQAAAQDTIPSSIREQMEARGLTTADVLNRIRASGLSPQQVRDRLRQLGYDPAIADAYLNAAEAADTMQEAAAPNRLVRTLPPPSGNLLMALQRIGVVSPADLAAAQPPDSARPVVRPVRVRGDSIDVFGRELFSATTMQFQPILNGPVDPDYRLGPGDELTLILTGEVELAYNLTVTPEGYIIIPDVGQVLVAGLTLDELKQRLDERIGRVYSGVQAGTTAFDLSMGRLRRNLVYVIGEVDVPGAFAVSGGATVFNALYLAGGPGRNGSFRAIQVRRNNAVVREVDLYSYLLSGDKSGDIRLEQGDVVFVPVTGRRVTVTGSVRRPAILELKADDGLLDVLRFAGGVEADAALERIQIDRILPPDQRAPGKERVLVDVPLAQIRQGEIPLADGDRIRVFTITNERRNRITITGDVHRPGDYEYRLGMSALEAVNAAQGLLPTAYTPVAHVVRLDPADSTRQLVRISFDPAAENYAARILLEDLDELVVFGRTRLMNPQHVEIYGMVKNAGRYDYSAGMTAEDLVLRAGGFTEGALEQQAEVARRVRGGGTFSDTLATIYRVPLNVSLTGSDGRTRETFSLRPGDQVFVRPAPDFNPLEMAQVTGEVLYPGSYTIESKRERISHLLRRAGGLTRDAYPRGFRLFRNGQAVGVDLQRALARPGSNEDLLVESGDRLDVPRFDPTVLVTGAVGFESRVRYEPGLDLDDYLARAGGVREDGDAKRVAVRYPNGELRTTRSRFGFRSEPRVEPGSTITVPDRAARSRRSFDEVLARGLTLLSTLATLLITYETVKN